MDREALLALVPRLRAYALALSGNRTEADDLVQEAVLRLLAATTVPAGEGLRPFAFTTLRNIRISALRRRTAEQRAVGDILAVSETAAAPRPESALTADAMIALLQKLAPALREAVILVGAHGLSHAEAASICGVAEGTMKARVSRARARLADLARADHR
ncbi:sigma-70 family RNA polymerase sigma factor [Elioraea sp.]|uniref:sigma-70 family RNA polymerase sigma factor n=1 Tax=Elioraea sp. TaxID=2185103 RepID=UPI0025B91396|nr:sigma-70 family RNA polymerase sigma factor [Elioraea sp.]